MPNEADTCRRYVEPKLREAGWDDDQIREQVSLTDGRLVVIEGVPRRRRPKRADYVLRYRRDFPIAIIEAKASYRASADGLQQAKSYAETLGLRFAYSTNGNGIVEHDYLTGLEAHLETFPSPDDLWGRLSRQEGLTDPSLAERVVSPYHHAPGRTARYYQEIAINRTVEAILKGQRRVLLTLATGTGKTFVAFQICWRSGRPPGILPANIGGRACSTWPTGTSSSTTRKTSSSLPLATRGTRSKAKPS